MAARVAPQGPTPRGVAAAKAQERAARAQERAANARSRAERAARRRPPRQPTPAGRAKEVAGIKPISVAIPPARYRRYGDVGAYPTAGYGRMAASSRSASAPESVTLTPPPHVIRRQAGLGVPSGMDIFEAVAGALAGAAVSAVLITAVPSQSGKLVAAVLTGGLGVLLAATSPLGTIPSEIGMGSTAASGAYLYFDVTGQVGAQTPSTAATAIWRPAAGVVEWHGAA